MIAVEWLVQQITDINYTTIDTSNSMDCKIPLHIFNKLVEQAKQVEKEQIIEAFNEGTFSEMEKINAEEYYNETYGL